jgi:hypothetical protein
MQHSAVLHMHLRANINRISPQFKIITRHHLFSLSIQQKVMDSCPICKHGLQNSSKPSQDRQAAIKKSEAILSEIRQYCTIAKICKNGYLIVPLTLVEGG